ncbi:hypothetical protein BDW69DRAFT_185750 [Aspergillus filifer]
MGAQKRQGANSSTNHPSKRAKADGQPNRGKGQLQASPYPVSSVLNAKPVQEPPRPLEVLERAMESIRGAVEDYERIIREQKGTIQGYLNIYVLDKAKLAENTEQINCLRPKELEQQATIRGQQARIAELEAKVIKQEETLAERAKQHSSLMDYFKSGLEKWRSPSGS